MLTRGIMQFCETVCSGILMLRGNFMLFLFLEKLIVKPTYLVRHISLQNTLFHHSFFFCLKIKVHFFSFTLCVKGWICDKKSPNI